MTEEEKRIARKELEEMNLIDDFLFQETVLHGEEGEKFCRILLSTILGRPVGKVRVVPQKVIPGRDMGQHGVRLDAYVEEWSDNGGEIPEAEVKPDIYDIEPNQTYLKKEALPRRLRFYHGLIDTKLLNSGTDYDQLPNVVIIMILPYDPFGADRMVYTIRNLCEEDSTISYEDGARKIVLYTKGKKGNPSQNLRDMLKYLQETREENVTNQDIAEIHGCVQKVKNSAEVGVSYMKSWERDRLIEEEASAKAREEQKQLDRAAIAAAERKAAENERKAADVAERAIRVLIETSKHLNATQEETSAVLKKEYDMPDEKVQAYLEKYW